MKDILTIKEKNQLIIDTLRRYKHRPTIVQKSLIRLSGSLPTDYESRNDLIQLIILLMAKHKQIIDLQIAATGILYLLTEDELIEELDKKILGKAVESTLQIMELFPNHQKLQENCLLFLCSDHILEEISFDRYKCIQLAMDSLVNFWDQKMNNIAVDICSQLLIELSITEKSKLSSNSVYMEKLLDRLESIFHFSRDRDRMLENTLFTICSLSDESHEACEIFVVKEGIDICLSILNVSSYQF
jgi:Zyg-11 family protein